MAAPGQTTFWNQAAGTKTFTHPLDRARFTSRVSRAARKHLPAEFKPTLEPGALLPGSDYPLQTEARRAGGYGSFRLPESALLRHHRRERFQEPRTGFQIEEKVGRVTIHGNPARRLQRWCRRSA